MQKLYDYVTVSECEVVGDQSFSLVMLNERQLLEALDCTIEEAGCSEVTEFIVVVHGSGDCEEYGLSPAYAW